METPRNYASVLSRVQAFQKAATEKAASSHAKGTDVADPTNKGSASIPTDAEATNAKSNLPENKENNTSSEGTNLEDKNTHPTSTGKNVPKTQDGNKKEDVSSPTDPLSKIAARVSKIANSLKTAGAVKVPEKDEAEKPVKKPKVDSVEGAPDSQENKAVTTKETAKGAKDAEALAADISPDALLKLASTIIATEGGLEAIEPILLKAAGQEAARQIMEAAAENHSQFVQRAAEYDLLAKQAAQHEAYIHYSMNEILKSASANDQDMIVKYAHTHDQGLSQYTHPWLKQAYMQGAEDAAAMEDSAAAMGGDPAAAAAAGGDPAAMGGDPEGALPGAEGPASIEQIAQILQMMVESGEIDEATAVGILEELAGGGAGGAEGGDPAAAGQEAEAAAMAGGADPAAAEAAEAAAMADPAKQANAICAEILSQIK